MTHPRRTTRTKDILRKTKGPILRWSLAAAIALLLAGMAASQSGGSARAQADALDMTSNINYALRPDEGTLRVSWDVTVVNNDPGTSSNGQDGVIRFYEGFSLPVLSGAKNLSASSGGTPLKVSVSPIEGAPIELADVTLAGPFFYGQTVSLTLTYDIAEARRPSLLVTPAYVFVPIVALGDSSTVTVSMPPGAPWVSELVAAECTQDQSKLTCAGSDDVYVAGLAEMSRPDLTGTVTVVVPLKARTINLSIKHFQGEEAFAQHVKDLAINALPVIEDLYGTPFNGPTELRIEERGKVATLGYEGLAECGELFCDISVTPIADDYTILHELGHLWSGIYSERWLQEGFAEFIAKEAAGRLAGGLVSGSPPERTPAAVELQLDDWGGIIPGASLVGPERDIETTGYYRAERFLVLLQAEAGLDVLKKANAAIAATGNPADSRRFMDTLEAVGGGNKDALFQEWVFPSSMGPTLADRRLARDRFSGVAARAAEGKLSDTVTALVLQDLDSWRFEDAQGRLDEAEELLADYDEMKGDLGALRSSAKAAGLTIGPPIEEDLKEWHFNEAADKVAKAAVALAAYEAAKAKVDAPRNPWERFGLLGSNPESSLRDAEAAFNAGDYDAATNAAEDAINGVNDASATATRRVLVVAGGAAAFAMLVLLVVWYTRMRDRHAGRYG